MVRSRHPRRSRRRAVAAASLAIALLAACARPASEGGAAPQPGEWRSFEGTWTAAGDRHTVEAGPDRQATILDLSGSILLVGERGLGAGFQARALTFSDGAATTVGRAVWTDERGDRIFSELRGAPVSTGRRIQGAITGGTGRWSGITGEYAFDWRYVVETEGRIQGRAVGLRGRARIVPPDGGAR
ncbi:MAG TPA: hypothetical protein VFL83_14805 [Anaeromyxobacter sp.]|nr:hypothetical protein [Anaeromyxobacter sp.]